MMVQNKQSSSYSLTGLNPYPWIRWWYALVAPPAPDRLEELPLKEREFLRRGKLTSIALLIEMVELVLEIGPASQDAQKVAFPLALISLSFLLVSALLNRSRKLLAAGLLIIIVLEAGMISQLANPVGGYMTGYQLSYPILLIQPLMISVLLFPAWGVLVVGAINALAVILIEALVPRASELQTYIQVHSGAIFALPIMAIFICALVSFIVITSLQESLVRADKAEEINKLHQAMAEQTRRELQTKQQLEAGVQEIVAGMTRFANGDQHARIRLGQGHLLWSVASSINNMIGRFVRVRVQGQVMEQTFMALQSYLSEIRAAKVRGRSLPLPNTGTQVDALVEELLSTVAQEPQQNNQVTPLPQQDDTYTPLPLQDGSYAPKLQQYSPYTPRTQI